jgi:hypothetical protein
MLSDKDFCIEFVERMIAIKFHPTKVNIEMRAIIIYNQEISIETMFDDEDLKDLFPTTPVSRFVYSYIRDNQQEFFN